MDKVKKIYRENRVFVILMLVVVICIICIGFSLFKLFFGSGEDKYKGRLDGIKAVELNDEKLRTIDVKIEEDEAVTVADLNLSGKVVYISIVFTDKVTLEDAKTKSAKVLEEFSEEMVAFYDFNFTIKQLETEITEGFLVMGAKNANGTKFEWNNNRVVEVEESE